MGGHGFVRGTSRLYFTTLHILLCRAPVYGIFFSIQVSCYFLKNTVTEHSKRLPGNTLLINLQPHMNLKINGKTKLCWPLKSVYKNQIFKVQRSFGFIFWSLINSMEGLP